MSRRIPIRNIIRHSLVDGPGNRVSIFTQGCNVRCAYCHNPETQKILPQDKETKGIKWMTAEEVYKEIETDIPFIRGITVSGGECMLFPEFLTALFTLANKDGLTTLIDTSGTISFQNHQELLNVTTGVMLDVKAWDPKIFKEVMGVSNKNVVNNLKLLSDQNKIEEIRVVCVPGKIDIEDVIIGIKDTIKEKIIDTKLYLIKYRHNGVINSEYLKIKSPDDEFMEVYRNIAESNGFGNVVISQ